MWISVRNWRKFQHYDPAKRKPSWIKNNLDLLSKDEYLELTAHQRAVLHGLWLEYAASGCQLRLSTSSISSRLGLRVTTRQLEALNDAGFIDIVASKSLADGYQDASLEVETEEEVDLDQRKAFDVTSQVDAATTTSDDPDWQPPTEPDLPANGTPDISEEARAHQLVAQLASNLRTIP